jgi:carbonic anhydrase/acetyltransferase-like protein (isoleucine patch superfamily)
MSPLIRPFAEFSPQIAESAFIADNATVVGDVVLGERVNVWYGTVIRGDVGKVRISDEVNIQDMCCLHMTKYVSDTIIAEQVSVGHSTIVHGAIIEAGVLVGMGCIVMDNVRIGEEAILGAGSLVTQNTVIPPRTLALGRPARVVRALRPDEIGSGRQTAKRYMGLAELHRQTS